MRDPVVHLYALCLNERPMLPYLYRNYEAWVDHFHIYDNGSSDGSQDYVQAHARSTLHHHEDIGPSHELCAKQLYDSVWKQSRGEADWVFFCDIDEHLWHPDMRGYLAAAGGRVTAIRTEAYDMVADAFPTEPEPLWRLVNKGSRLPLFDKLGPFNPNAIEETNFGVGRHVEQLVGDIRLDRSGSVKLLHYKQLGPDYVVERHARLAGRLGEEDKRQGWGGHWAWRPNRIRAAHRVLRAKADKVPGLP